MICRLFTYLTDCLYGKEEPRKEATVINKKETMLTEAHRLTNFEHLEDIVWNVPLIRSRINEIAQEIRLLKKEIRTPHHQVTWNEQCELRALKHRATVLATLQAFRRKKLHIASSTLEDQSNWLESHLDLSDRRELARIETPTS